MVARDEVKLSDKSDEELLDIFSIADEQGHTEFAGQALDEYFSRHKQTTPPLQHNVPKWLEISLPAVFWRQKSGGGGD